MRRHPRVIALRLLAVALALFTARLVATDLATLHRRAADLGPLTSLVEARRDLPLGATVAAGDVRVVERHERQLPDNALSALDDVVGTTVVVPIVAGAPVLRANVAPRSRLGSVALVRPDHVAMRLVSVDGLLPPVGSVVRILVSLDPGATAGRVDAAATVVADAARVLEVDADREGSTDAGVLLEVRSDDAPRVAFATANGVTTLVLLPPEDACCVDEPPASS